MTHVLSPVLSSLSRLLIVFALLAGLTLAIVPARAQSPDPDAPVLRATISVQSGLVTLGDLFSDAGMYAEIAVFRAPDPGKTGTVRASRVAEAARKAGLKRFSLGGVTQVRVARASTEITAETVASLVRDAISKSENIANPAEIDIRLTRSAFQMHADTRSKRPVRIASLRYSRASGRFDVTLQIDDGLQGKRVTLTGSALETREIATVTRTVQRGTILGASDVHIVRVPVRNQSANAVTDLAKLVGMESTRTLIPGRPILRNSVTPPTLVKRGSLVTIAYQTSTLTLTTRGRALENGKRNAIINVMNLQSKRILQARVNNTGLVVIAARSNTLASLGRLGQ